MHNHNSNDRRICKVCRDEKLLKEFSYHSATDYFSRTCLHCTNKIRRGKYEAKANLEGRQLDTTHLIDNRRKICKICGIEKLLNQDYYRKKGGNFSKICLICHNINKKKNLLESKNKVKYSKLTTHRYSIYRAEDFRKGLKFGLTKDYLKSCLSSECTYCNFAATGLDRLDNSLGHTNENCIPCCVQCNHARNNYFTYEETLKIGVIIREIKLLRECN